MEPKYIQISTNFQAKGKATDPGGSKTNESQGSVYLLLRCYRKWECGCPRKIKYSETILLFSHKSKSVCSVTTYQDSGSEVLRTAEGPKVAEGSPPLLLRPS